MAISVEARVSNEDSKRESFASETPDSQRRIITTSCFELPPALKGDPETVILARFVTAHKLGYRVIEVGQIEGPAVKIQLDVDTKDTSIEFNEEGANFITITRVNGAGIGNSQGGYYKIVESVAAEMQIGGKISGPNALDRLPLSDQFEELVGSLKDEEVERILPLIPEALEYFRPPQNGEPRYTIRKRVLRGSTKGGLFERVISWHPVDPLRINLNDQGLIRAFEDASQVVESKRTKIRLEVLARDLGALLNPEVEKRQSPMDCKRTRHVRRHPKIQQPVIDTRGRQSWRDVLDHSGCRPYFTKRYENALELLCENRSFISDGNGEINLNIMAWVLARSGRLGDEPQFLVKPMVERGMIDSEHEGRIYTLVSWWKEAGVPDLDEIFMNGHKRYAEVLLWSRYNERQIPGGENGHRAFDVSSKPQFSVSFARD